MTEPRQRADWWAEVSVVGLVMCAASTMALIIGWWIVPAWFGLVAVVGTIGVYHSTHRRRGDL